MSLLTFSILWLAVGGTSVGGSAFKGSCTRYDHTINDNGPSGACSADFAVTQLIYPSPFSFDFFLYISNKKVQ